MTGKVYIASMNMRGKWATPPDGAIKVNVTSTHAKTSKYRLAFSPMTPIEGGYKGYWNFESYWQSGKVFEGIPLEKSNKWWRELKEAKRRYPNSKGKKVLYSIFDGNHEKYDYVESRKKVYVPEYYNLIKDNKVLEDLRKKVEDGKDLVIYDFDGPREENGEVSCRKLSIELLKEKINITRHPFGHGYVVAASILGIEPAEYIE